ncbi:predicted protein [Haematococcus lacustris]|uniref:Uncharacterized protein n=1 Tax=Haematococcus lacustris TaxID=44745 RepID=A0A699YNS5_HAELA|nr:predicted protein [Haematococcus lacustris]
MAWWPPNALRAKLQRLLGELDSTPRDHKDREWMQQRVLALQQFKAALQQEEEALLQKELYELQQRGTVMVLYALLLLHGVGHRHGALHCNHSAVAPVCVHASGLIEMDNSVTESKLYSGITLYTPRGRDSYRQRNLKFTTHTQLAAKLSAKGYDTVAIVDSMPLEQLGPDHDGAQDVDDVELADGMQLAVVVDADRTPLGKLAERLSVVEDMVIEYAVWQRGCIRADENRSLEWAVQYLIQAGHKDVRPYGYKQITLKQDGSTRQIEIAGMAVSDTTVVLVERKPIVNMKYVDELLQKLGNYEYIVDNNAPNTAQLATTPTVLSQRKRKPVQAVLMADGWVDDEVERAACKQVMLQAGILPVLPRADSYAQGDSCNSWPPQPEDKALAAQYASTHPKQARAVGTNATVSLQHTKRSVCISIFTGTRPHGIRHVSQPRWVAVRSACVFR